MAEASELSAVWRGAVKAGEAKVAPRARATASADENKKAKAREARGQYRMAVGRHRRTVFSIVAAHAARKITADTLAEALAEERRALVRELAAMRDVSAAAAKAAGAAWFTAIGSAIRTGARNRD